MIQEYKGKWKIYWRILNCSCRNKRICGFFEGYEDCYTIIGGAACEILLSSTSIDFRATKDIDIIIMFEDRFEEFASKFWEYIKLGGYKCGWKNSDKPHFYRFTEPKDGFPSQIELFSRKTDYHLESGSEIIPIHIDDDISSLSAIMLNDDFYDFMREGKVTINGLGVLKASYIIPFKMYAWLNLKDEKASGEHVNSKDLKKHKNDVFQLFQIVPDDEVVEVSGIVADTIDRFIKEIVDETIVFKDLGIDSDMNTEINALRDVYIKK